MKLRKFTALLLALLTAAAVLTGCDTAADSGADTVLGSAVSYTHLTLPTNRLV